MIDGTEQATLTPAPLPQAGQGRLMGAPVAQAAEGGSPRVVIDFHFNVDHPLIHACRVVRKALGNHRTVLVFSRDAQRLARLDSALWTFSALDFLPHAYADSELADRTPVWLSMTALSDRDRDVLLPPDDTSIPVLTERLTLPPLEFDTTLPQEPKARPGGAPLPLDTSLPSNFPPKAAPAPAKAAAPAAARPAPVPAPVPAPAAARPAPAPAAARPAPAPA